MKLQVKAGFLRGFKGEIFEGLGRYRDDDHFVELDADKLTAVQLDKLVELAKADPKEEGSRKLLQRITSYQNIRSAPEGKKIGRLEILATALRAYIEPSPNKWVFYEESDGYAVPYYVKDIDYERGNRDRPARVEVELAAVTRGSSERTKKTFYREHLGKTVSEILNDAGYYLETPEAVQRFLEDVDLYKKYSPQTGAQFRCSGTASPLGSYSYSYGRQKAMVRDGIPAKVVMDDLLDDDGSTRERTTKGSLTSNVFWGRSEETEENDESDEPSDSVVTPVHPYVKVFDLDQHEFVLVHVRNLTPYEYDKSAAGKLVLHKDTKDLVTILVEGSAEVLEDIIEGKTGGTIVIATGPPGTGKTLTAQVFSEEIERPLYVVQCAQLGTGPDSVEKELQKVLIRASRWKAILLIDEADVYIHERGSDIDQNAIVGVFLRVLENYRGVLFLTSNRTIIIDDAIMSRATAWIRYNYPTPEQLRELWAVLSKQYRMEISDKAIVQLVERFPKISGRNIKNLLKLAGTMIRRNRVKIMDVKLFEYVSAFLDLSTDEEKRE
jgi:hypothetical protein